MAGDEIQALWREFRRTDDSAYSRPADRQLLAARQVRGGAARLGLPAHVDEGDLVSYGLLGLIERDRPLRPRARHQVRDLRDRADPRRRSSTSCARSTGCRARCARAPARSSARSGSSRRSSAGRRPTRRSPTRSGSPTQELEESLIDISRTSIAALDELWSIVGRGRPGLAARHARGPGSIRPADALDETEMREALAEAISRLPEREKLVVTLYYYEELTLREIGEVLGVTESRVSQLHTKAILRLRSRLHGAALPRSERRAASRTRVRVIGSLDLRNTRPRRSQACPGAREDPQRRRRRPPRDGQDLARRGDALPGRRDQPPRHGRGGHDGLRLGRGRAAAADVARRVARAPALAGPEDQPDRHAGRLRLPGRQRSRACASSRARSSSCRP